VREFLAVQVNPNIARKESDIEGTYLAPGGCSVYASQCDAHVSS
jgi:hypothetical protein